MYLSFKLNTTNNLGKKKSLALESFVGIRFRKSIVNGFRFYNKTFIERHLGGFFGHDDIYDTESALYYIKSDVISISVKEMLWSHSKKYFSLGIGVSLDIGSEINSVLIKERKISAREINKKEIVEKYKLKNDMLFLLTIPIELSWRFSKNKENSWHNSKLFMTFNLGIQDGIYSKKIGRAKYVDSGFGLQIGF